MISLGRAGDAVVVFTPFAYDDVLLTASDGNIVLLNVAEILRCGSGYDLESSTAVVYDALMSRSC